MDFDPVNKPKHYNQSGIECINAIQASMTDDQFAAYCKGNVMKYLWRYEHKNKEQDLRKAEWYLQRLIKVVEGSND
tara:strand:+ start:33 stop:260 length:228 start_codon:yes stop_codon:yes gene_type:complete